jgi:hypothetical protein
VGRPVTAIRHFHNAHLGIGGRDARFVPRLAFLLLPLLVVPALAVPALVLARAHGAQRRLDRFQTIGSSAPLRRLPPLFAGGGIFLQLALETAHQLLGRFAAGFQRPPATKRAGAGTGPDPHAIERQPLEAHQPFATQHRDALAQQPIEQIPLRNPEVHKV